MNDSQITGLLPTNLTLLVPVYHTCNSKLVSSLDLKENNIKEARPVLTMNTLHWVFVFFLWNNEIFKDILQKLTLVSLVLRDMQEPKAVALFRVGFYRHRVQRPWASDNIGCGPSEVHAGHNIEGFVSREHGTFATVGPAITRVVHSDVTRVVHSWRGLKAYFWKKRSFFSSLF